jgi:hypothetical protein
MAAAAASEVRVASRRIVDYLNDGEELGVEGAGAGAETPPCTPAAAARSVLPKFRWPRLARLGKKGGAANGKGKGKGKEEAEVVAERRDDDPPMAASTSGQCARLRCASPRGAMFSEILQIDSFK